MDGIYNIDPSDYGMMGNAPQNMQSAPLMKHDNNANKMAMDPHAMNAQRAAMQQMMYQQADNTNGGSSLDYSPFQSCCCSLMKKFLILFGVGYGIFLILFVVLIVLIYLVGKGVVCSQ